MGMYGIIWAPCLCGKDFTLGCFYIWLKWLLNILCMSWLLVLQCVDVFLYGKRLEESVGSSSLWWRQTLFGLYMFHTMSEHKVLVIRRRRQWRLVVPTLYAFTWLGSNVICFLLLLSINVSGSTNLRDRLIYKSWVSV